MRTFSRYLAGIILVGVLVAFGVQGIRAAIEPTAEQLTRALRFGDALKAFSPGVRVIPAMASAPSTAGPKASYDTDTEKAAILAISSSIGAMVACKMAGEYDGEAVFQDAFAHIRAIFLPHEGTDTSMGQFATVVLGAQMQSAMSRTAGKPTVTDGKLSGVVVSFVRGEAQCKEQENFLRTQLLPGAILDFKVPAEPSAAPDKPAPAPTSNATPQQDS